MHRLMGEVSLCCNSAAIVADRLFLGLALFRLPSALLGSCTSPPPLCPFPLLGSSSSLSDPSSSSISVTRCCRQLRALLTEIEVLAAVREYEAEPS